LARHIETSYDNRIPEAVECDRGLKTLLQKEPVRKEIGRVKKRAG
jgi:hypothetical protein